MSTAGALWNAAGTCGKSDQSIIFPSYCCHGRPGGCSTQLSQGMPSWDEPKPATGSDTYWYLPQTAVPQPQEVHFRDAEKALCIGELTQLGDLPGRHPRVKKRCGSSKFD